MNEDFEKIMEAAREQLIDGDAPAPRALAEAQQFLAKGDAPSALELLLPLCEQLFEVGKGALADEDAQPTYFDLDNIVEQVLLVDTMNPEHELKPALLPFVHSYALCAFALHSLGRYEEAIAWLQRALTWNPVQPHLYFEIAEGFKCLKQFDQADAWTDRAYVVCADPLALARWYRAKSFCAVERGEYELAAAELLFSTAFEQSPAVASELEYLKTEHGQDFTAMDQESVVRTLQEHHLPLGPNEAALQALATSVAIARENGDLPTARECALRLYALTGDDAAKALYDSLVEE